MRKLWLLLFIPALLLGQESRSGSVRVKCCQAAAPRVFEELCVSLPTPTPTPTNTPTATVTGSLPPTNTPTATPAPTDVPCAFRTLCDNSALTGASVGGQDYAWANPGAARSINTSGAGGLPLTPGQSCQSLRVTNFAGDTSNTASIACTTGESGVDTLPDSAIILGIKVTMGRCFTSSAGEIEETDVHLIVGGLLGGVNQAKPGGWGSVWGCAGQLGGSQTYGSATDLWGFGSLSGADLKGANFGLAVTVRALDAEASPGVDGWAFTQICYKLVGD